ncbi:carboxypeptidase regulatory-like domain-containing protein [Sulfurimonas sp. SAG-AH-194-L11]|nr:carboxypeptidase-like regulatory domain-containing protein [Sulfurimonas sp. SAG-AH-194-L11]MDF1877209.1 carboxypeptidase regulatory-like domain-containing protein [Sulfurimonas sp. SAG-AH-194-L11]
MNNKLRIFVGTFSTLAMLGFTGCGGGSSDTTTTPSTGVTSLTGTVAIGVGQAADISFIGAAGNTLAGRSVVSGAYSVDASSLSEPIMVRAILDSTGSVLYSFAESATGVVNVTPLTSFVVDQAAQAAGVSGGAAELFQRYTSVTSTTLSAEIDTQVVALDTLIANQMSEVNATDFDHFSGEFDADQTGYDALLDNLDIVIYNDDIIIREGNTTLDTLNYDVTVTEINATGSVYDIATTAPLSDANVTFTNNAGEVVSVLSDVNGTFNVTLETLRTYTLTIQANGYNTQTLPNISSFVFTQANIGSIPMFPASEVISDTTVTGSVIDGRTAGTTLANATIAFRNGYDVRVGDAIQTVQTDASGAYTATLANGVYTAEVTLDGYATVYRNIEVYGDTLTWNTSILAENVDVTTNAFATVSLNWDENPSDLDSHLTGLLDDNTTNRFHMYYSNRTIYSSIPVVDTSVADAATADADFVAYIRPYLEDISGQDLSALTTGEELFTFSLELPYEDQATINNLVEEYFTSYNSTIVNQVCSDGVIASLDRDRTSSYDGLLPETTTLCDVLEGSVYKYYVHHYSGTSTMSGGNAQVTVTTATGITQTFNAPTLGETGYNDIWHVFDIDSYGNIYPVNEIIGNGSSSSVLFASPLSSSASNTPFVAETNLVADLPSK